VKAIIVMYASCGCPIFGHFPGFADTDIAESVASRTASTTPEAICKPADALDDAVDNLRHRGP